MVSKFKSGLLLVAGVVLALSVSATKRKVLFIGNSYTYTNNMPLMLQSMATSFGDTLVYDESDPGGYTFANHCTNATTIAKIFSQQWDIVVLQEQSQMPAFPPAQVATDVYPYAHKLDSMIHANDSCTQTMFLMTWGHANGDPMNCGSYPAICTYHGMQQRLRESYLQMTQDNHAIVAPVGMAWQHVMDSIPSIWLYISDSSHPVIPGSYLETCVLYSSIFHKKSFNSSYTDGLSATVANTLQHVSDKIVFDSLSFWQQYGHYPYAGFTTAATGSTITFSEHSPVSASDYWSFGDGGHDTAAHPVHIYASNGNYVVSHTAANACFTETLTDTVHIGTTGIELPGQAEESKVTVAYQGNGQVSFQIPDAAMGGVMDVCDATGRTVKRCRVNELKISEKLTPGLYIYIVRSSAGVLLTKGKVAVY